LARVAGWIFIAGGFTSLPHIYLVVAGARHVVHLMPHRGGAEQRCLATGVTTPCALTADILSAATSNAFCHRVLYSALMTRIIPGVPLRVAAPAVLPRWIRISAVMTRIHHRFSMHMNRVAPFLNLPPAVYHARGLLDTVATLDSIACYSGGSAVGKSYQHRSRHPAAAA